MTLKAASDAYTDAMVDLGLAKTIQLAEIVEAGFERLENSVRKGIPSGSAGAGGGMSLAAVGGGGGTSVVSDLQLFVCLFV
jgi:L-aminopeptidase/D-esterase-like protein